MLQISNIKLPVDGGEEELRRKAARVLGEIGRAHV